MTSSRWFWAVVVLVAAVLGTLPLRPPFPAGADAAPTDFSAERAMVNVAEIGRVPHAMGSLEIVPVREHIVATLEALGLTVDQQAFAAPDYYGAPGRTVEGVNVVARLEGTASAGAVLFIAHYDTVPWTPGANDNSTGVAALLEAARALTAGRPLGNDIVFLFTDGEEPGPRYGATAFVSEHPWYRDVGYVVNLETNGRAGASLLAEVSGRERELVANLVNASPNAVAFSYLTEIADLIGNVGTDFTPFLEAGVPGLHFAYLHGSSVYHTPRDSIDNVGEASLQHHGEHVLGLARRYGDGPLPSATAGGGANYFTVAPRLTVIYGDGWAVGFALIAIALAGWALAAAGRVGAALRDWGLIMGGFLATSVIGGALWMLVASIRSEMGIFEGYGYAAILSALFAGGAVLLARRMGSADLLGGLAAFSAVIGLPAALFAPGLSYLFAWPAIVGAILMLSRPAWAAAAGVLTVLVVTVLQIPWIDFLLQMAMPRPGNTDSQLLPLGGIPFAFVVLGVLTLREAVRRGRRRTSLVA